MSGLAVEAIRAAEGEARRVERRGSERGHGRTTTALPDLATCPECRAETFAPKNRRYRYPFTSCARCGPRYSIIRDLPYDRERTTMARFTPCPPCREEYADPGSRRFHAETIACPACGPKLSLSDSAGRELARRDGALIAAAQAIRAGLVVAIQGLGGFHLVVDARSESAVATLRARKGRASKPFAVMVPSLAAARRLAWIAAEEAALLTSREAPIVLLERRGARLAASVAPDNPYLGVLLPYTPLHHLLLQELDFPIVATSGNRSDEPICIEARDARLRLAGIADLFLIHDRPIERPVEDSVARLVGGRPMLLRRGRGYAPLAVAMVPSTRTILAAGGPLKNSVALSVGGRLFAGPHLGDLEDEVAHRAFKSTVSTLVRLHDRSPDVIACDAHADDRSSRWAREQGQPIVNVQHQYAHVLAGMADNGLAPPILGVAWDGGGPGQDGTRWGGEFLSIGQDGFERVAHLRAFPLPGGDRVLREPRRSALGVLYAMRGDALFADASELLLTHFTDSERVVLRGMLRRGVHCPLTSSAGRLFDAVAALIGLHPQASFEGEAAMALEHAAFGRESEASYPFELAPGEDDGYVLDWAPTLEALRRDARRGLDDGWIALRFHNTLAEMIVAAASCVGERRVLLSGGCFQNRLLSERTIERLRRDGFEPFWHRRVPPNDGGIAVGQALAASRELEEA